MAFDTYSIANDTLNGAVSAGKLSQEIKNSSITTVFNHIRIDGNQPDDCVIHFDGTLSGAEQTTLDGVVAAHDGIAEVSTIDLGEGDTDALSINNTVRLFSKEVDGYAQLCATADDGYSYQITPVTKDDSQGIGSVSDTNTTNATYVDMANMTLTTNNTSYKKYLIMFSCEAEMSSTNKSTAIIVNINGVDDVNSERTIEPPASNSPFIMSANCTSGLLESGIVIKIRYKVSGGTVIIRGRNLSFLGHS